MAWKKVTVRTLPNNTTLFETMTDESIAYIQTNYVDTDFEKISDEVNAYIKTNYVDNNKRTSFAISESDNGLVLTYTSVFADEDTKNEFLNDSTIKAEIARRNKVNTDNDITTEITVDEEV